VVGNDPRQLRFTFALWTRAMVRELIRREFGVRLSEVSVGRLLRKLGLSPQRPLYRAYQQTPEAVARWKAEAYPQLRAEAAEAGATIYFADEAGVRSGDHAGTTWAPVGQTPVVATTGDRFSVNLISAVTAKGALRFAAYDGYLNGPVFLDFCRRLLDDAPGPVFLVLDGHPVHRSKAVKAFAESTGGRLRLCFLPGYAPGLNPDERVEAGQARPDRPGGGQRPRGSQSQGAGGAAPAATAPALDSGLLPGPEPTVHHRLASPPTYIRLGSSGCGGFDCPTRTPLFATDGRHRPVRTALRTAVGRSSLAGGG
jgi:DDE superfamily endonuclease/Winged helix-turn helix